MENVISPTLKQEEWDVLTTYFRLAAKPSTDRTFSLSAADLLDERKCVAYLDKVKGIFQTPSKIVAASLFSKRYSFLVIAPSLYAMTMFNKAMDYSVENSHMESSYQNKVWLPNIRMIDWDVTGPSALNRFEWRDKVIQTIFADHLANVWRCLSKTAKVPIATLWENTAIYVYWLYEKRMREGANAEQKRRIEEDYQYLLHEAPAFLFGENINPLKKYDRPKCMVSTSKEPVRIRQTCCYYYQISANQKCCSTCPRNNNDV